MTDESPPAVRPILVAVDFSPASTAALAWAAAEARAHDVPLVVLHVVHEPEDDPGWYRRLEGGDEDREPEPLDVAARRAFDEYLERCGRELRDLRALGDVDTELVTGIPHSRIVEVADGRDAAHVVVGSRGRKGLRLFLGGSTAARVAQLSPRPVTIVKVPPEEPPR